MRKVTKRLLTAIAAFLLAGPALGQQLPADVPNVCVAAPEYVGRNAGGGTSSPYVVIDAATGDTLSRHNDLGNAYEAANAFTFTRDSVRVQLTHLGRCPEHLDRFLSRLGYELVPVGTTPPDTGGTVPPDTLPNPGPTPGTESLAIVSEDSATATLQAAFGGSPTVVGARGGPTEADTPVCPPFRTGQNPTSSPATSVCQRRSSPFDVYAVIEEGGTVRTVGPVTIAALPRDTTTNPGPGPGPGPGPIPPPSGWPSNVEPPRATPDTVRPAIARTVRAGTTAELTAAIGSARPGEEILLTPGGRYSSTSGIVLPPRNDGGFVVIRTDIAHPMVRVDTTANLAEITCTGGGCAPIRVDQGGDHGWRVELVRVTAPAGTNAAVRIHQGGTNPPRRIVLDRIHVRSAGPSAQLTRGVLGNAASIAVMRSVIPDAKGNQDTQAFVAWNTPGPILLYDNFLGGAGENVLLGGADPASAAMVPSDVVLARNHVWKDPSWRGRWVAKNLLELKIGKRVHIWGNVFENHWRGGQSGYCILFKTANQSGGFGDFSETGDVYFERNIVRNCDMGFNLARLPQGPGVPMHDIAIENVVCERLGPSGDYGGSDSQTFLVQGPDRLSIRNTTCPNPGGHSAVYIVNDGGDRFDVDGLVVEGPTQYGVLNQTNPSSPWGALSFRGWSPNDSCSKYPAGWSCSTPPAGAGADLAAVRAATAGVVR